MQLFPHNPSFTIKLANLPCQLVEVVETGEVGVGWDMVHLAHVVELPGREDEERALGACLEALKLGFPVLGDGLFLQVDEWIALFEAFVLHHLLAFGDAWRDDDGGTCEDVGYPMSAFLLEEGREVVGCAVGRLAMAEHLHFPCPAQKEDVAEGSIVPVCYAYVQPTLHEVGAQMAKDGSARVVLHVAEHGGEVALIIGEGVGDGINGGEADGVIVVVVEEGARGARKGGIVLLALPF